MRADIKKRSTEAQRLQKKAKKIRSGSGGFGGGSAGGGGGGVGGGGISGSTLSVCNERNFSPASQEILRAADAAQLDLSTRLAILQVRFGSPSFY